MAKKTNRKSVKSRKTTKKNNNIMLYGIIFIVVLAIAVGVLMMIKSPTQKMKEIIFSEFIGAEKKYNLSKELKFTNQDEKGNCIEDGCEYVVEYKTSLQDKTVAEAIFYKSKKIEFNKDIEAALNKDLLYIDEIKGKDNKTYYLITSYNYMFDSKYSYQIVNDQFDMVQGGIAYDDVYYEFEHNNKSVWVTDNEVHFLSKSDNGKVSEYKATITNNEIKDIEFVSFHK